MFNKSCSEIPEQRLLIRWYTKPPTTTISRKLLSEIVIYTHQELTQSPPNPKHPIPLEGQGNQILNSKSKPMSSWTSKSFSKLVNALNRVFKSYRNVSDFSYISKTKIIRGNLKKTSIFKYIIQIEVDPPPSQPIFDKVLIMLTSLPPSPRIFDKNLDILGF